MTDVLWDLATLTARPANDHQVFFATGAGTRILEGAPAFDVTHTMAGPSADRSPGGIAAAAVTKVLRLRALSRVRSPTMLALVDAQCRADDVHECVRRSLHKAFDMNFWREDVLLLGYDDCTTETVIAGPAMAVTTMFGRTFMKAAWRLFFCAPDQPALGHDLVRAFGGGRGQSEDVGEDAMPYRSSFR